VSPLFSSRRLRLASLAPALAAVLTIAVLLWLLLPRLLSRAVADQLLDQAQVVAPLLLPHLAAARPAAGGAVSPESQLQAQVLALPAGSPLRITVITAEGLVLADSARPGRRLVAMENHATRPEVRAALSGGVGYSVRRSDTTGSEYVYAARLLSAPGGERWVLRLATPLVELGQMRNRLATIAVLAVLAALAAMMLVSLWLDRRLLRPLVALIRGARLLAAGQYEYRLLIPKDEQLALLADSLNRLAGRAHDQIGAVETERDHLYQILARMSEGVLVVGADGRAEMVNPAFRTLFSIDHEVRGLTLLEITRLPQLAEFVEQSLHGGESPPLEVELDVPEHRMLVVTSSSLGGHGPASGASNGNGNGAASADSGASLSKEVVKSGSNGNGGGGAVVVVRDISASNRLAATRRDFVANVSHELRTPLAAIRGYAETLRDGALEEPEHAGRFVGRILAHCTRLQALLDDLLTLSRLESSAAPQPAERVDLAAIAERAVETLANMALQRRVAIHAAVGDLPPICGDGDSLERLLLNLLENAIKYNREGGQVDLGIHASDSAVEIVVRDTGFGIPAESLPRLFERFYRVDKGRSRAEGGTGLGLAIVKHIAQLHGGTVEVESREGVYSQFRVRLPQRQPSRARGDEGRAAQS
jgi:two-component system phosphate regulon sensor histidine kinase PhoR